MTSATRRASAALVPQQDRSEKTRRRLLDAAVDELSEVGYARLTTSGVATRAGVSRGAQQHHFPHRATLVGEAVRHLADRQLEDLRKLGERRPSGTDRTERVLDLVFRQYSGPLFAAMLDLSTAARTDRELTKVIGEAEQAISREMRQLASELFDVEAAAPDFQRRFGMALSTARGTALLILLGHPRAAVTRQWAFARAELVRILTRDSEWGDDSQKRIEHE